MSIAAVSRVGGATVGQVSQLYGCAVNGCNGLTEGNYCDAHREECQECGAECEKGTRILYVHRRDASIRLQWCDDCARTECGRERDDGYGGCWCGGHERAVAAGAVR